MQGWHIAGKSWTAFIGGLIISALPMVATVADVLPMPWGPILSGTGLIVSALTGVSTYHAPYAPVPPRTAADSTGHTPWPN